MKIEAVWVVSGPIFRKTVTDAEDAAMMTVGNGVGVPYATYKVIGWFDAQNNFQCRAYIVQQDDTKKGPKNYLRTVHEVESLTGLNFFADLEDPLENRLEAERHAELWR